MNLNLDASTYGRILADAFKAEGWTKVDETGSLRMFKAPLPRWLPDWVLDAPSDPNHPCYDADVAKAIDALDVAEKRGELAGKVLDRLRDEGVIA
jgi:hypothetical protein